MSHYFTNDPILKKETYYYNVAIGNISLKLTSSSGIFSKKGLDKGTEILLKNLPQITPKTILDVGCGIGVIGLYLSKLYKTPVTLIDVNKNALDLARKNAILNSVNNITIIESNFFESVRNNFDLIVSNPPIRIGKEKLFNFYDESFKRLNLNGTLLVVVKKSQGADSHKRKIFDVFF